MKYITDLDSDPGSSRPSLQHFHDAIHLVAAQTGIYRQTQHLFRDLSRHRQIIVRRRRQPAIHGEITDQRVEIPAHMNVVIAKLLIEGIATAGVVGLDQNGKVRIVGAHFPGGLQATYASNMLEPRPVSLVDGLALGDRLIDSLELQKTKRCVEFAHLAVDARRDNRDFVDKSEVLEVVDSLPGLLVGADDGAAFECCEYLRSMEAEHRQVSMIEDAAAVTLYTEGVRSIVNDLEAVVVGDGFDAFHVTWMSVAMYGHDGRGLRRDRSFDPSRVQIQGVRVDVDEHRLDAVPQQRMCRGYE